MPGLVKTFVICMAWLCLAARGRSQVLSAKEFIDLNTKKFESVDSLMKARGFQKQEVKIDAGSSLFVYTYIAGSATNVVSRSFHYLSNPILNTPILEYGVTLQKEAADFMRQLQEEGFEKKDLGSGDRGDAGETRMFSFVKGTTAINYMDFHGIGVVKMYIFSTGAGPASN